MSTRLVQNSFICRSRRSRQAGVALITVLLVFAIAAIVASKVVTQQMVDTQRVVGMIDRTQAYYYARAAEQLAMLALREDEKADLDNSGGNNSQTDDLTEFWAAGVIPFEIDNIGKVFIQVIDLNRFFNLNNLLQPNGRVNKFELNRFRLLLTELDLDPGLAENLADWLDADEKEEGYQSESDSYERLEPPYQAGNRAMSDVSELRLVSGFTPEVVRTLAPYVCAVKLKGVLPLNINTAVDYALTSLEEINSDNSISLRGAQNIISNRPYESVADFDGQGVVSALRQHSPPDDGSALTNRYDVKSNYFEINVQANYAGTTAYLTTLVYRPIGDIVVLSRRETDNSQRFAQFANYR